MGEVGWAEVETLVGRMRASGLDVELTSTGPLPPPPLMPTVHRVVQETLTNSLRHAPGSSVRLRVTSTASAVEVEAVDDGATTMHADPHGYGLVGLRERLSQVGGTLVAGERPGGGYAVRATMPREDARP